MPAAGSISGPSRDPLGGRVASVTVGVVAVIVVSNLLGYKYATVRHWQKLPWLIWLIFAIYSFSLIFVSSLMILQHGVYTGLNMRACNASSFLCLGVYLLTKVFIYLFLVDRAYIVSGSTKSRLKSKLYLWNAFGMLGIYIIIGVLDFVYRIAYIYDGQCVLGIEWHLMIPLIAFDCFANIYLTALFLAPLMRTYSIRRNGAPPPAMGSGSGGVTLPHVKPLNTRLRKLAIRTIIGCVSTLCISMANVTALLILRSEVVWLCMTCCTVDIIFTSIVIHWITLPDDESRSHSSSGTSGNETILVEESERETRKSRNFSVPPATV